MRLASLMIALLLAGCSILQAPPPAEAPVETAEGLSPDAVDPRVELLWDDYGVPHIFAQDPAALFYAAGWAQMRSHSDLLLRLYGQARGRAAEYWGESFVESDTWMVTNGVPQRAQQWLEQQQPHIRAYLDAFAAGINAYGTLNADSIGAAWRQVLPVTAADVLAHQQRVLQFTFMANPEIGQAVRRQVQAGSNAWAIAPGRAAGGNAMLLMNPHLPWGDLFTWYEMHVSAPDLNAYGATLVGMPLPVVAFNERLGWTHTVNTIDGVDLYRLTLSGDGYLFDGEVRPFETTSHTLRVRRGDGGMEERPLQVRHSVHGPVIGSNANMAVAMRVAGLDAPHLVGQYWDMLRANGLGRFEAALSRLQLPMFTVMYADRDGNIMHLFNGTVPVRQRGDWGYWQGVVSGDSSNMLWTRVHSYGELPRYTNPTSGWLQNANDPPWTTTLPLPDNQAFFPPYMAPPAQLGFRPQRSVRMLHEDPSITWDELMEYKHSTRMEAADHLVQDLVAAARASGDSDARAAAAVLEAWDREADADSRGAVLFVQFLQAMRRPGTAAGPLFEVPWTATAPLATPDGLADPRAAVAVLAATGRAVRDRYGAMDVPWGDVYRLRMDDVDLPANGGPGSAGIFRVVEFMQVPGDSLHAVATSGDSYVAAVEFGSPVRARSLLTYGNASQPGSPHRTDQLRLFARKELKPVYFTRDDVLPRVRLRETF